MGKQDKIISCLNYTNSKKEYTSYQNKQNFEILIECVRFLFFVSAEHLASFSVKLVCIWCEVLCCNHPWDDTCLQIFFFFSLHHWVEFLTQRHVRPNMHKVRAAWRRSWGISAGVERINCAAPELNQLHLNPHLQPTGYGATQNSFFYILKSHQSAVQAQCAQLLRKVCIWCFSYSAVLDYIR